jgi:hypothetical protein
MTMFFTIRFSRTWPHLMTYLLMMTIRRSAHLRTWPHLTTYLLKMTIRRSTHLTISLSLFTQSLPSTPIKLLMGMRGKRKKKLPVGMRGKCKKIGF